MKILIVSDIHGNYPALQAIWEKEKDSDVVLIPGDLVDWGFFPHECVTWAREHDAIIVAGNHDHEVLDAYAEPPQPGETRTLMIDRNNPEKYADPDEDRRVLARNRRTAIPLIAIAVVLFIVFRLSPQIVSCFTQPAG